MAPGRRLSGHCCLDCMEAACLLSRDGTSCSAPCPGVGVAAGKAKKGKKGAATAPPGGKMGNGSTAQPSAAADAANGDGFSTPPPASAQPAPSTARKSVTFSIKRNLYFAAGGPVPEPDIRTPPPARPKGPALKRVSAFAAEAAKTPKQSGAKRAAATPKSVPRARAADFF